MRFFNTSGACEPDRHYMVPAAERLKEARLLIDRGQYFVVHAPRQSGKTTTLRALAHELTATGRYAALHVSCKVAEPAGIDVALSQDALLDELRLRASEQLAPALLPPGPWPPASPLTRLRVALSAWSAACPLPLVLFLDEADALVGPSQQALLSQLHAGFSERPRGAPWSVALCGLRDIRDYRRSVGKDPDRFGSASPFNVQVKSFRLADFTKEQIRALYAQHTADTGQRFTDEAIAAAFALTQGQPWLVNALAREIIDEMAVAPPAPITADHIESARDRLIMARARATHLDSLASKLYEDRVRRVIEPLLAGTVLRAGDVYDDDTQYARDLGLLAPDNPLRIANPIYHEVIARVLSARAEPYIQPRPRDYLCPDGRLDLRRVLLQFADFWREHGEILEQDMVYHEAAPQLVLLAFLQRIVNGGGQVSREYGLGRGRIDVGIRWRHRLADGTTAWQRLALELKVWRPRQADPLAKGLAQLDQYWDRFEPEQGALVLFDRRQQTEGIAERIALSDATTPAGRPALLLRA